MLGATETVARALRRQVNAAPLPNRPVRRRSEGVAGARASRDTDGKGLNRLGTLLDQNEFEENSPHSSKRRARGVA